MFIQWYCLLVFLPKVLCSGFDDVLGHIKPSASAETQAKAVSDLIKRTIPTRSNEFEIRIDSDFNKGPTKDVFTVEKMGGEIAITFQFEIDPNLKGSLKDAFRVEKVGGKIVITGSTGVAAATGFNHYLKYYCKNHISWSVTQLNLPEELPNVNVTIELNDKFRYYQNVCTTSYSFVWWNWQQWEKHIDWMVLNSFNLVLAFNGQEAIWERVYKKFNLTQKDIDEHFTGPAFLSWLRMGNMRGFGGPLSEAWHTRSVTLQKNIVQRMRSFGIVTVLPAFAGHVPRAFYRLYPSTRITKVERWMYFNDTYCCPNFVDPTEKLFTQIGEAFMSEQISEFGTDHVYNCDSFNEITPSSGNLTYLGNVSRAIFTSMTNVDPQAVWVMQNWLFVNNVQFWTTPRVKALLTAVPKGRMIILDLQSDQFPKYEILQEYFGQPYIWCMLHDFGGTLGMFGSSSIISEFPIKARLKANSTMIGIGLTPEGIHQNYPIYDLMMEHSWRKTPANLTQWFEEYSVRRYGIDNPHTRNTWSALQRSVYDFKSLRRISGLYAITDTPSLDLDIWTWYNYTDVFNAWSEFLQIADQMQNNSCYKHDLVDLTRQVLQIAGDLYYVSIMDSYKELNFGKFSEGKRKFLDILHDLDTILLTDSGFLLGTWLESARNAADTLSESIQFEYNARNQITLWGPEGEIDNYAIKQWSGVVSNVLKPRWQLFLDYVQDVWMQNGTYNRYYITSKMMNDVEVPFTLDRGYFPAQPVGDPIETAKALHKKWFLSNNNSMIQTNRKSALYLVDKSLINVTED